MEISPDFCYFCQEIDSLIQMSTNSLIIDSVYIDFAQLILDLFTIKIDDDCNNKICVPCKDQLSQFYVMKQRAKLQHLRPDDIRKAQIISEVSEFLDSIFEDCVVTKHPKLLSIHPDTNCDTLANELYNCNCLLESQEPTGYSLVEIKEDSEIFEPFEIELEESSKNDELYIKFEPNVKKNVSQKKNIVKKQTITDLLQNELTNNSLTFSTFDSMKTKFVCTRCGHKTFTSEKAYRAHIETHLNDPCDEENQLVVKSRHQTASFDPSYFEQKLWIQDQLQSQKRFVETVDGTQISWSCSECNFVTVKRPQFRNHLQQFHTTISLRGPNKHSCFACHLRFDGENHLNVHNNCHRIFDVIAPHVHYPSCESCKLYFCSIEDLQIHLNRHEENPQMLLDPICVIGVVHRNGETFALDDDDQEILDEDAPVCGHCLKKFSNENDCKIHLMLYHVNNFICPFDSREFQGIPTLSFGNHLRQCHPDIFSDLEIKCSMCKMQFETVYDKLAHMKNCEAKMFQCDHCEKRFFKKPELKHHLKVVMGLMVFACEICGKRCKDQGDLKIHVRSHTNDRPYPCPHCDKAYKTSSARASHVESHMEQTHVCGICNVKFRRRILYQRHMKLLHDEKHRAKCFAENTCAICGKSYLRKTHYKNHMKTHNTS